MVLKSRLEYFNPRAPCGARLSVVFGMGVINNDFNPRAPCGARQKNRLYQKQKQNISTHAPLAGRDLTIHVLVLYILISTHAPLAGRDPMMQATRLHTKNFNPRAPCGARRWCNGSTSRSERISTHAPLAGRDRKRGERKTFVIISTHAPLAGRDFLSFALALLFFISTHAPLAGRDSNFAKFLNGNTDFNPRAPCGARPVGVRVIRPPFYFNPRAPCGARRRWIPGRS